MGMKSKRYFKCHELFLSYDNLIHELGKRVDLIFNIDGVTKRAAGPVYGDRGGPESGLQYFIFSFSSHPQAAFLAAFAVVYGLYDIRISGQSTLFVSTVYNAFQVSGNKEH